MFMNLTSKQRFFLNMVLSQIGFAAISTVAILSDHKISAIIAVNIVFAIIVGYINYNSMQRVVGGINRIKEYIENLMDYMFFRTNNIRKAEYIKNDDIGAILKELNQYFDKYDRMRKDDMHVLGELVIALDKVAQGIYSTQINSSTSNFMVHTLKEVVNKMLVRANTNIEDLVQIIGLYSEHDYRRQVNINPILKGKMKLAMEQINQLGSELNNNAKHNLENGTLLEKNSLTMNRSVENLANKANAQAASLEETAAALEEITSITKNNTQNAHKMSNLSKDVKDSVILGENLANKTASSMDEINAKVEAINEAIEVIDQIAFQTNILSLNAAVEAATAGEAGKGFAVVAQEVRNLANRSAEAAKEIKDLVENATSKTNDGKKISDEMKAGYSNLNKLISETIDIIQDVSIASSEQLKGIEQINDAVSILDRVTQENASEASNVAIIANETLAMAKILVEDAKTKKVS
ncbi:methyl-accepting chemotaxis protein [Aliarcobacter cryaerophilus]|uniref:methyl-accepting chemotaxis protein n=1 Tax=Aliarcobacter cryaerophilus TaxID=28198 RepID=UPI0021B451DB|nr:methyl-accepting chemotaxis protein [Aliarcobacter cryaerophilus]MCT7444025.1 methyl-accepting chemotaxis protein [Aliarcobacter cryaerophilus]MCT7478487.1 methyl-accepting chemotaxis protein [Aliarcobacter cryaerophilus]MCT7495100.1 methyl-accepting chemotaxis protein [Aliarcobacter cryaerophilus]MCT7500035.1 methyl-accepting chemotaxis protein [Aliarcobacter cryaerophilus]MCT7516874.1 methyl-accepting chemotaxis protein [Aliarcobacter cryaerophilus]